MRQVEPELVASAWAGPVGRLPQELEVWTGSCPEAARESPVTDVGGFAASGLGQAVAAPFVVSVMGLLVAVAAAAAVADVVIAVSGAAGAAGAAAAQVVASEVVAAVGATDLAGPAAATEVVAHAYGGQCQEAAAVNDAGLEESAVVVVVVAAAAGGSEIQTEYAVVAMGAE